MGRTNTVVEAEEEGEGEGEGDRTVKTLRMAILRLMT